MGALSLLWFGIAATSEWPVAYLMAWLLVMVALVPVARRVAQKQLDPFEPINGICILYAIYFGAAAVYNLNTPLKQRLGLPFEDGVVRSLCYATLALVAVQVGYMVARRGETSTRDIQAPLRPPHGNRVFVVSLAVYAVGLAARLYGVSRGMHIKVATAEIAGQYGGVDIFYDYLGFLSTYGFILMTADGFASSRWGIRRVLPLAVMLPLELFFAFLAGPKEYFIPIVLGPVIMFHYVRHAVSARRAVLPLLVFAFVVFPVMTSYRSINSAALRRISFWDGVQYGAATVVDEISSRNPVEYITWSANLVLERMDGIYSLTAVVDNVPATLDYQLGKTILVGFAMLVPTFIWEDKYSYLATVITWGERIFGPLATGSGISVTQPGELFLNFGPVGMVLGMMALGFAVGRLYSWLLRKGFFGVFVYSVIFPTLVIPEYPIAAYYSNAVKQAMILLAIGWLAGARKAGGTSFVALNAQARHQLASFAQRAPLRVRRIP